MISVLVFFIGCDDNEIVPSFELVSITVELKTFKGDLVTVKKFDKRQTVSQIVIGLNDADRALTKFYATHRLTLIYLDGHHETLLCSGTAMKYKGLTYEMKNPIEEILQGENR